MQSGEVQTAFLNVFVSIIAMTAVWIGHALATRLIDCMDADREAIPDDIAVLKEALAVDRVKALEIAAKLAVARAKASEDSALIAQQKLRIAKSSARLRTAIRAFIAAHRPAGAYIRRAGSRRE